MQKKNAVRDAVATLAHAIGDMSFGTDDWAIKFHSNRIGTIFLNKIARVGNVGIQQRPTVDTYGWDQYSIFYPGRITLLVEIPKAEKWNPST